MRLRFAVIFFAVIISVARATDDLKAETSIPQGTATPPVKLDKTLRRALLRALTDLETESAEQHVNNNSEENLQIDNVNSKKEEKNFEKSTFSFNHFSGDDEITNEDKLQNSTFIEIEKFVSSDSPVTLRTIIDKPRHFLKVTNAISPENSSSSSSKKDQTESRNLKSSSPSSANEIETVTTKSTTATQFKETLIRSESSGIAAANALVAPRPTASSPTVSPATNTSSRIATKSTKNKDDDVEDVKIFQAPLVAAFTVQQDERGIPKSVVPIYRPSGDGQALTLQEQLDFKQKLLEKQLADLQQQQIQQTQFLLRQQQAYEEQVRQKQQQDIYNQEQASLKRLQEQTRLKQIEEQRQKQFEEQRQKQYEEQRQKQFEEQRQKQLFDEQRQKQFEEHVRLKQLEEQRIYQQRLQQLQQQQQNNFHLQQLPIEQNNVLSFKQQKTNNNNNNVRLQPSIGLELPQNIPAIPFQFQFQDQLRAQQHRQQQQFHQQQNFHQQFPQQQQQQQLPPKQQPPQKIQQQTFAPFSSDFQPPIVPPTRFNRQEAFASVGNFGFNNINNGSPNRNTFNFNQIQQRQPSSFDQFSQFRQTRQPLSSVVATPAKQIQNLLYQSGIANELQNGIQGFPGSQEDLNIVSKVLALNVGAVPSTNNLQFDINQRALAYNRAPSVA